MTMIRNILFPVDFSPSCVAMMPLLKRAAAMYGAKVTLLHVVEIVSSGFELVARPVTEVVEEREYLARERLNSFLAPDFPVDGFPRVLRLGDPAVRIAEVAREGRFDIIVMPTHAGTFRRMLLGSTTAKVLNDADCPVLTTEHAETITPRPLEHREWVCATGLQQDSERVLRHAALLAESVHANLQVIHAIPAAEPGIDFQFDLEGARAVGRKASCLQARRGTAEERRSGGSGPYRRRSSQGCPDRDGAPLASGRNPDRRERTTGRSFAGPHLLPVPS